jgi:hypothetical protein
MSEWQKIKYRVRLKRLVLVDEECEVYIDAIDVEAAEAEALEVANEIAAVIWLRSNSEPQTTIVESVKRADSQQPKELKSEK